MLSNDDLKGYFSQMSKLESDMRFLYKECSDKVEDGEIKKIFSQLSLFEAEHILLVERIAELLQK
jgi:rubrerythrin